jgi:predicted  nucleic acid-binding Zn-ribbon protein
MPATSDVPLDAGSTDSDLPNESIQERFSAFSVVYVGLFVLLFAYLGSVRVAEHALGIEFQERVDRAVSIDDFDRTVIQQIQERIDRVVHESRWVRWGGLRVTTLVLAQDGVTWLYVDGLAERGAPDGLRATDLLTEWMDLLPAHAEVTTTLPHNALISNSILIVYTSILLQVVYVSHRRVVRREAERLNDALTKRDDAARRAASIEDELAKTRTRLTEIEPLEREQSEEVDNLQREREQLHRKLAALASREEMLRNRAETAMDLTQEVRALEDLLDEATGDLDSKNQEIERLEVSLKKASKTSGRVQSSKAKASENLAKRFRTLYKTVEIDDRAIEDIVGLGDESLRLKAEECVKRLADDADNVAVRRKVGGLPDHVQVFELGFAGKGRMYYARGKARRFRVLCVGAKNTQPADLDYLSRMSRDEFN